MKPMGKSWVYFKRQFTFKTINLYDYRMSFIQKNLSTVISRIYFFPKDILVSLKLKQVLFIETFILLIIC